MKIYLLDMKTEYEEGDIFFFSENGDIFISFVYGDNIYFYEYEDIKILIFCEHRDVLTFLNPNEFTEAYSEPNEASKTECFAKIVNGFLMLVFL